MSSRPSTTRSSRNMRRNASKNMKISKASPAKMARGRNSGVPRSQLVLSNVPASSSVPSIAMETKEAAFAFTNPFEAYQRGYTPPMPRSATQDRTYVLWSRTVNSFTDVLNATGGYYTYLAVQPALVNQLVVGTTFAGGTPTVFSYFNDPLLPSFVSNFADCAIAYQGTRVRNLTPVLQQGGESVVGRMASETSTLNFGQLRSNTQSYAKSSADPGVILQMTYVGSFESSTDAAGSRSDYCFSEPTSALDGDASVCYFAATSPLQQTWEVETVTCYHCRPFITTSNLFKTVRSEIDISQFFRLIDKCYSNVPEFSLQRNTIRDDGVSPVLLADSFGIFGRAYRAIKQFLGFSGIGSAKFGNLRSEHSLMAKRFITIVDQATAEEIVADLIDKFGLHRLDDVPVMVPSNSTTSIWSRSILSSTPRT